VYLLPLVFTLWHYTAVVCAVTLTGLKTGEAVACAVICGNQIKSMRLPDKSSVYTAELSAIRMALKLICWLKQKSFVIYCIFWFSFLTTSNSKLWYYQYYKSFIHQEMAILQSSIYLSFTPSWLIWANISACAGFRVGQGQASHHSCRPRLICSLWQGEPWHAAPMLQTEFGVTGTVLSWLRSYLSCRSQFVKLGNHQSPAVSLDVGVPQGSVLLGLILFDIYCSPVGDVIDGHDIQYHQYADDTAPSCHVCWNTAARLSALAACTSDVRLWYMQKSATQSWQVGTSQQLK